MSDQTIDTKQLRELLAKATPEPWEDRVLVDAGQYDGEPHDANFDLAIALRNAAPALLDELDRLRWKVDELEAWYQMECAKRILAENKHPDSPNIAAMTMRDGKVAEMAGVTSLLWTLARGEYGCHKNDVLGVIDIMENFIRKTKADHAALSEKDAT